MKLTRRLIRLSKVCEITSLPRSSVYRRMSEDPTFPRRVQIGGRAVAWIEAEVDAWVAARIAERDEPQSGKNRVVVNKEAAQP